MQRVELQVAVELPARPRGVHVAMPLDGRRDDRCVSFGPAKAIHSEIHRSFDGRGASRVLCEREDSVLRNAGDDAEEGAASRKAHP